MCPAGVMLTSSVMCASRVKMRNTSHHFALQVQYITVHQHNITAAKPQLHFFNSKVFRNFVDAFPRFAHLFGSVDRFEPAKCIFCYRSPTAPKLWTDSNRHTPFDAFPKSFPFKIYLQSHRCNGILDRFELSNVLLTSNSRLAQKMRYCFRNIFLL